MESTDNSIHQSEDPWHYTPSTPTRSASRVGDAWVLQGVGNYELEDLNALRHKFPRRRVTLDGDVITVWPSFTELDPGPVHPAHGTGAAGPFSASHSGHIAPAAPTAPRVPSCLSQAPHLESCQPGTA